MSVSGDRIRSARKLRGLTMEQVADAIGTTKQTIHRLELGRAITTPDRYEALAAALGTTPAWLLGWSDGPITDPGERRLVDLYRSLNAAGQDVLMTTAQSLAGNPALRKDMSESAI